MSLLRALRMTRAFAATLMVVCCGCSQVAEPPQPLPSGTKSQPVGDGLARGPGIDIENLGPEPGTHELDPLIEEQTAILRSRPDDFDALLARGKAYREREDYSHALGDLTEAVRLRPDCVEALIERGRACFECGALSTASDDFERAVKLAPDSEDPRLWAALAYEFMGHFTRAWECYEAARTKPDATLEAYLQRRDYIRRGWVHALSASNDQALALMGLLPRSVVDHVARARRASDEGQWQRAIDDLTAALETDPDDAAIYLDRGQAYRSNGQLEQALADFNRAVDLMPGDTGPLFHRAELLRDTEDLQGAIRDCRACTRLAPGDWLSHRCLGSALFEAGDNQRALEAYKTAIRLAPTEGVSFCERARIHDEMGDYRSALADFDKAIELGYDRAETYALRAKTRARLEDFEGALADLDMAVEKVGKCPAWIDFARGLVYEKAGQPQKAKEHFQKAREADPSIDEDPPVL